VQSKIDDIYRGRVFSVYDVVVNGAIVSGAVIAALLLPNSGDSYLVPLIVATIYLIAGLRLLRSGVFFAPPVK
jgi:archaellum component FlaF (FlaF/FlaG flagellin family)